MKETLNLPKTSFSMRANLTQKEPELLAEWDSRQIYRKIREARAGAPTFVFHDGPPYANGDIHHGHVLNKTLKDIVIKSKTMGGFNSPYLPGWDCHGLPIEHKVEKELRAKSKPLETHIIRKACRAYAQKYVEIQRKGFVRLGVFGEWDHPYLTMSYGYESAIARQFARFVRQGFVYKGKKPVHWDWVSRTALAEAEVEYHDHTSPSVYVAFPMPDETARLDPALGGKDVRIIIWTTTPWTLPANMAIAFHPDFTYLAWEKDGVVYIFAEGLAEQVKEKCGLAGGTLLARIPGSAFDRLRARHPWIDRDSVLVLADYVTLESGTGCVHTAPGHGADDFFTGMKYGIDIYSPVDDDGCFTDDVEHWAGMNVFDANAPIVEFMQQKGCLLAVENFQHSYPYGWRSKAPVIFRSTEQWFVSIDHENLRERALDWIRKTTWYPSWGEERISNMVANRPDWCISRQRSWGVPIIAFKRTDTGESIIDADLVDHVAGLFEQHGADVWFEWPVEKLLPDGYPVPADVLEKEMDILDVWFDSGISHAAVLGQRDDLPWPSDLYMEGSDQHRGWFQSSLLCGIVGMGGAPYKTVITHGFLLDGQGRALSKSLGNDIPVENTLKKFGAEVLRLWVAQTDYRDDIKLSDEILSRTAETYRKIRNTARFMLGNLYDFDPDGDMVPVEKLEEVDRYALHLFDKLRGRVLKSYDSYEFHTVYHAINQFVTVDLSAFYLDIHKDRLYCELSGSTLRRSAQSVIFRILDGLVRLVAPVLSFTADEIWSHLPAWDGKEESVHLALFPQSSDLGDVSFADRWERLRHLRQTVLKELEAARDGKIVGQSLDAKVILTVPEAWKELVDGYRGQLAQLFIVSQVEVREGGELAAEVVKADGAKCQRCWNWSTYVGTNDMYPETCERCTAVLEKLAEGQ
jgi:isoleucyl-tRNA synthetase